MSRNTGFVLAVAAVLSGCVDPSGKFDEFAARVVDAAPPAECSGTPADITGEHLLSITPIIASSTRLNVIATISNFTDIGVGFTMDIDLQPLAVSNREEVGNSLDADRIEISTVGCFDLPVVGTVAGAANPITGQDIDADIVISASILDADTFCGTVSGTGNDVDLTGSTFLAVRVDLGTRGDDLPMIDGACPE